MEDGNAERDTYLAKSSGITFREHTDDVRIEASCLIARLGYRNKFERLTGQNLREEVLQAAEAHDLGKKDSRWQRHVEEEDLSLLNVNFRHELESLCQAEGLTPVQEAAIAAHHGKLSARHKHRWTGEEDVYDYSGLWQEFTRRSVQGAEGLGLGELALRRYEHDTVRAILRLADQRASQIEGDGPDPLPVRPFRYQFDYDDGKRPVQSLAEQNAQRQFLALRAETGSGKTDAALLWARKQVRQRKARRVIFALPTRFTSTSLAEDIGGGLYHSSAWRRLDGDRVGDRLEMASTFLAPRVVTTIDQVLAAVAGRRELDHTRFANLAHSALVIDECDFYDDVVQANIDFLTDVCDALGVPVIVMSATLPTAQTSVYFPGDEEGEVLEAEGEGEWSSSFTIAEVKEAEEFPWEITGPRAIVYANTTARARRFYRSIAENRQDVVLYHSRFTEPDKAEKERQIRDMLGENGSGGVAVMTQIGEMSLNVSAPLQISDLPPADRLAQRTGRMGRFEQIDGELRLIIPQKNGRFYPAPYGTLVRGEGWTPAPALLETKSALEEGMTLSKQDLTELTDRIYGESMELSAEATKNRQSYADVFKNGWLVLPDTPATDEDLSGSRWQARMIPPTEDVWVAPSKLEGPYESFRAWRLATSKHTCTVPHYVTEAGEDKLDRTSVRVSQEEKSIAVLKDPSIYSSDEGLLL